MCGCPGVRGVRRGRAGHRGGPDGGRPLPRLPRLPDTEKLKRQRAVEIVPGGGPQHLTPEASEAIRFCAVEGDLEPLDRWHRRSVPRTKETAPLISRGTRTSSWAAGLLASWPPTRPAPPGRTYLPLHGIPAIGASGRRPEVKANRRRPGLGAPLLRPAPPVHASHRPTGGPLGSPAGFLPYRPKSAPHVRRLPGRSLRWPGGVYPSAGSLFHRATGVEFHRPGPLPVRGNVPERCPVRRCSR